tara:strand:+ start:289 stop:522 length:234 start_codon:yes stop_codon:yes gene_type:complete
MDTLHFHRYSHFVANNIVDIVPGNDVFYLIGLAHAIYDRIPDANILDNLHNFVLVVSTEVTQLMKGAGFLLYDIYTV